MVFSSGIRLRNDGYIYIALNHQIPDLDQGNSRERIFCYDSVNEQLIFYYEKESWYGRSVSIAMRYPDSDVSNEFYLGGNTDPDAAQYTDDLVDTVYCEFLMPPRSRNAS